MNQGTLLFHIQNPHRCKFSSVLWDSDHFQFLYSDESGYLMMWSTLSERFIGDVALPSNKLYSNNRIVSVIGTDGTGAVSTALPSISTFTGANTATNIGGGIASPPGKSQSSQSIVRNNKPKELITTPLVGKMMQYKTEGCILTLLPTSGKVVLWEVRYIFFLLHDMMNYT